MQTSQRRTFFLLLAVALASFITFIPFNRTGAADPNMLAVFEIDEYAQYPHLLRMLTPGDTFYQTLRNFLVYLHYFYGYVFYFLSAVLILPVKLALGSEWADHTRLLVTVLRQGISVLPMLAANLLLVWMQTRYRSWWRALGLFLLLLAVPAVVVNNLWWHPDSLVQIFIILTLFFLDRDAFQYKRDFLLAAAACGLAIGTKNLGLFFVLCIPVYLGWGVLRHIITCQRTFVLGAMFLGVMLAAVVISNPLLLLPQERAAILATQSRQIIETSTGMFTAGSAPFFASGYPQDMRVHYGEAAFVLLSLAGLGLGIANPRRRLLNVLILAWMIPLSVVIITFATRRTHYWLPVLLPAFSSLVNFFPEGNDEFPKRLSPNLRQALQAMAGAIILLQLGVFAFQDNLILAGHIQREEKAPAVRFFNRLESEWLAQLPQKELVVFRDWKIYFPTRAARSVEMSWAMPNLQIIAETSPDLIILEQANLNLFSNPAIIERAIDPGNMQPIQQFYAAAQQNGLPGYQLVLSNSFAAAYLRDSLAP
jgi:hypothetical protein